MADLQGFLAGVSLSQYHGGLVGLGVSSPSDLVDAEDADLEGIGMKKVEIGRLRRSAPAGAEMSKEGMASAPMMVQAVPAQQAAPVMTIPDYIQQPGMMQQPGYM